MRVVLDTNILVSALLWRDAWQSRSLGAGCGRAESGRRQGDRGTRAGCLALSHFST